MSWLKTRDIKDLVVTTAKMALKAIDTAQMADLSVTEGKIASKAVTTSKLGSEAVTPEKTNSQGFWFGHGSSGEEFNLPAGGTLPAALIKDMQTANITGNYLAATSGGVYRILSDSTSEAQAGQLVEASLQVDPTRNPVLEAWVKLTPAGATLTADQRIVVGLCSAHANAEDALDSVTNNVWFRIEAASLNILVESDDGTTDTDDQDSGVDLVKGAWTHLKIDLSDLTAIRFIVDGVVAATTSAPLLAAPLQFIACYQRDAGAEVDSLDIDWFITYQDRS